MRLTTLTAAVLFATGALSACGTAGDDEGPSGPTQQTTEQILSDNGMRGLEGKQVVERLEATNEDRGGPLAGSVTGTQVELTTDSARGSLPLDRFYLSIAPYVQKTHDCFNHNLATCQELVGAEVDVTITDSAGKVLVDETATTHENGFVGFWLPKDITGTIKVSHGGRSASTDIATGAEDPTCLTTLKLV